MQGQKESGFNVSSAYVLKSDMESSFPVELVAETRRTFFALGCRLDSLHHTSLYGQGT